MNVNRLGVAALAWILDADGSFYPLKWIGLAPRTWMQALGLARRLEVYEIGESRSISNGELVRLTAGLTEQFEEAPNSADLRASASLHAPESPVTAEQLRAYLGE